jgi:hypothetical protein
VGVHSPIGLRHDGPLVFVKRYSLNVKRKTRIWTLIIHLVPFAINECRFSGDSRLTINELQTFNDSRLTAFLMVRNERHGKQRDQPHIGRLSIGRYADRDRVLRHIEP